MMKLPSPTTEDTAAHNKSNP
jgi:hypothetical protein